MTQHELMMAVLRAAGGQDAEAHVPAGYTGKIADIVFPDENLIIEVKTLTTDRAASEETSEAVSDMFVRSTHLGAPVVFGTVNVGLHDLPSVIAANTLRIAGKRVLSLAKDANAQLKASKRALSREDAIGVLVLVTPPFRLDRRSIIWLVGDAMRDGRCRSIEHLFLVETPLSAPEPFGGDGNSFISLHSRPGAMRPLPGEFGINLSKAWGIVSGQRAGQGEEEDFYRLGATS